MGVGVRIWHPTARNGTYTFAHNNRPYRRWNKQLKKHEDYALACPPCGKLHKVKTYHVKVDDSGFAIVTPIVWHFMEDHGKFGFELANEVLAPPPIIIRVGEPPQPATALDE